ncbi:MAG: YdcF family protein [Acidimicrobiia bacterium]|nr:YdcF family protein [Acidimicrobiia bacterium]
MEDDIPPAPPPPRRTGRIVVRVIAGLAALCALYVGVTFVQVWRATTVDERRPVDAIVVLGAAQYDGQPSPVFEARLRQANQLFADGYADVIVTTGSNQLGDRFTEGFAGYDFLRDLGVPDESLLVVVDGSNTWEQLTATVAVLDARAMNSVLLVSDPYHSYRAELMADAVGLEAYSSPADVDSSVRQLVRETAAVSVGRLLGFRRISNLT